MERRDRPCSSCGVTDWRDGTEEEYATLTAKMRERDPELERPHLLLVCEGCGSHLVVLRTTFYTGGAG
jgi:hypothetical protein